jgi:hypothetical protein
MFALQRMPLIFVFGMVVSRPPNIGNVFFDMAAKTPNGQHMPPGSEQRMQRLTPGTPPWSAYPFHSKSSKPTLHPPISRHTCSLKSLPERRLS